MAVAELLHISKRMARPADGQQDQGHVRAGDQRLERVDRLVFLGLDPDQVLESQSSSSKTPGPRGGGCPRSARCSCHPAAARPLSLRRTARARPTTWSALNESPGIGRSPAGRAETHPVIRPASGSSSITGSRSSRISRLLGGTPSPTISSTALMSASQSSSLPSSP